VFLVNPPHTLKAALQQALPAVLEVLGRGRGQAHFIESGG
jgi:23S rRNA (adenine2030-N6)-methyltransferase